jgi:hypothetical protein
MTNGKYMKFFIGHINDSIKIVLSRPVKIIKHSLFVIQRLDRGIQLSTASLTGLTPISLLREMIPLPFFMLYFEK